MILKKNSTENSIEIGRNKYEHFNIENSTSKLIGIGLYKNNEEFPIIWFELDEIDKTISFYKSNKYFDDSRENLSVRFQDNYLLEFKDYTLNQA